MGLPKQHRLKRRDDFNRVYQKGLRFRATCLTLRVLKRNLSVVQLKQLAASKTVETSPHPPDLPTRSLATRIGISISTKVDKRSVVRNRIRRQIQAIFRQLLPCIPPNWDLLVIAHPMAVQCDYPQFLRELEQLLVDAEVIHGDPRRCVL